MPETAESGRLVVTEDQSGQMPRINSRVATIARIYDYWLGGKDNFEADRTAGDAMIEQYPDIVRGVRLNRAFLGRAVHYLAAEAGIRQFLDIGTGLPSANNTHEVAQRAAPESRIVYADNDPIVLAHARVLLASAPEGACAYIDADIRDTGKILQDAAGTLDFSRPVAVCLIMVLQFVPDGDDPWKVVRTLLDAMPSGSYLAVAHPANDVDQGVAPALRQLSTRMGGTRVTPRSHPEIERFFGGLEMIEPGLVQLHRWRPGPGVGDNNRDLAAYGGLGRKP
jgi:S-adenosyl methyltransferase